MTVYTNDTFTDWFVDDDAVFEFVDALGNDVIIADELPEEPVPSEPIVFFGFLRMVLWQ